MIALLNDCLLFQLATGESVPCSAEMISVEIVGGQDRELDPEILRHAAASVFHYFKKELMRETVSVGEFAVALERVLRQLGLTLHEGELTAAREILESDLRVIACQSAGSAKAAAYQHMKRDLLPFVLDSYERLRADADEGRVARGARARAPSGS